MSSSVLLLIGPSRNQCQYVLKFVELYLLTKLQLQINSDFIATN